MMKKLILMLALMSCVAVQIQAQGLRNRSQFGVKVGVNYANVYDSRGEKFNAEGRLGVAGGFFFLIAFKRLFL